MSYSEMYGLCRGNSDFASTWRDVVREAEISEEQWIRGLREHGIKAAHPDDGWVDRGRNTVYFAYPHFNDGAKFGDLIALGWHFDKTRIVRIVGKTTPCLGEGRWVFEEVGALQEAGWTNLGH
ncbi:hypothetical protein J2801_003532 [Paraburkholderia phenoliruptrix]|uniref:hypothetical protein n=1 Tax=Paraburkholderia phenoliruptrix TaxID=252970 RepID=UPI00285ED01D|nr:hypothetical protein [Paraburkholderia phenoliruptrix]MDR6421244.1 hypothetical protein [Paraburkholderia phenoliruptrix]